MKLLVVILNYRVTDLTIECLRTLEAEVSTTPGFHVAVIENGTGGDAYARLKAAIEENGWGAWVDLDEVHPNRGFTGGNNILIRKALASASPPEYFLLLNADTLAEPGALRALVDFMDATPGAGIGGSQLLSLEGKVEGSPFRFQGIATELDRGMKLGIVSRLLSPWGVLPPTPTAPASVDWVSGASMILRRSMLDQIGLLDEGLYTYFDDIDLCLRARRAGWQTWYVPSSRVVHLEGASTGIGSKAVARRPPYWFEARRRFFLKSYGPVYTALADAAFIAGFATWRVRRRLQRKPDRDPPRFLADSIRHSVFVTGFTPPEVENPAMKQRPS